MRYKLRPRRLKPGSTIMLVAPSSYPPYPRMNLSVGINYLSKLGFKVVLGETVKYALSRWYHSAPDEVRARDLMNAFTRDDVDAVWCVRGGTGALRILDMLDYDKIRENPKVLIGFSDITALQNAIYSRTGLPSLQGPMVAVIPKPGDEVGMARFRRDMELTVRILMGETPELRAPEDGPWMRTIIPGKASGIMVGGNLIIFTLLQTTPFKVDTEGSIVFLEDIQEEAWRIDNYLTTLTLNQTLTRASGIIYGEFPEPEYKGPSPSIEEVIIERTRKLAKPSLLNYPCCHGGDEHGHNVYPAPIGIRTTMDTEQATVQMEEPLTE